MVTDYSGMTGAEENIRGHVGNFYIKKTAEGRPAIYFDISWGINDIPNRKFNTWRHCIAYDKLAESLDKLKSGDFLKVTGWITTNPVYKDGKMVYIDGRPITKEYLMVTSVFPIERESKKSAKQLSLVA